MVSEDEEDRGCPRCPHWGWGGVKQPQVWWQLFSEAVKGSFSRGLCMSNHEFLCCLCLCTCVPQPSAHPPLLNFTRCDIRVNTPSALSLVMASPSVAQDPLVSRPSTSSAGSGSPQSVFFLLKHSVELYGQEESDSISREQRCCSVDAGRILKQFCKV